MAKRTETAERKVALLSDLRAAYHRLNDAAAPVALSQRELCAQYELSAPTISQLLQQLVQEGVLYTVPRVGTFMGRPPGTDDGHYLLVSDASRAKHIMLDQVQTGFEDRIAQLGGASDAFTADEALSHVNQGELPIPAGRFFFDAIFRQPESDSRLSHVHNVIYAGSAGYKLLKDAVDSVDFDHEEGGRQAAQHLLQVGHRNIAFLGLHSTPDESGEFVWSAQRARGWRLMMQNVAPHTKDLEFHAESQLTIDAKHQTASARKAATNLLQNSEITAVIAVNVYALHGLLEALGEMQLPPERWPAIVCFDETPRSRAAGVSYLRLPWEKLGAEAAQLLWDRKNGHLTGPPQHRLVKMHLIPRLTCRPEWAQSSTFAQRRVVELTIKQHGFSGPREAVGV